MFMSLACSVISLDAAEAKLQRERIIRTDKTKAKKRFMMASPPVKFIKMIARFLIQCNRNLPVSIGDAQLCGAEQVYEFT
jgi:hypothetical protein